MTTEPQPEIYLRDVSSHESVELFFRHCIYKSQPEFFRSARSNLYFAPYFTRITADEISHHNLVPVGEGISFVAKIKLVQVVETRALRDFLRANDVENPREAERLIRADFHGDRRREALVLLLGRPRLMFLSPVTKRKLAGLDLDLKFTAGSMGSRSCSFDDLLAAAQL